jgi:hypothetical protein
LLFASNYLIIDSTAGSEVGIFGASTSCRA